MNQSYVWLHGIHWWILQLECDQKETIKKTWQRKSITKISIWNALYIKPTKMHKWLLNIDVRICIISGCLEMKTGLGKSKLRSLVNGWCSVCFYWGMGGHNIWYYSLSYTCHILYYKQIMSCLCMDLMHLVHNGPRMKWWLCTIAIELKISCCHNVLICPFVVPLAEQPAELSLVHRRSTNTCLCQVCRSLFPLMGYNCVFWCLHDNIS